MSNHRETPVKRTNPGGVVRWVARYTASDGKRYSAGTFGLRREAQDAINEAYKRQDPRGRDTVGSYFAGDRPHAKAAWLTRHPRSDRTDASYAQRVGYVLDVRLRNVKFRDWPINDVTQEQVVDLLDHMLRVQGRAADGARGVLRVLSAMWQDAISDQRVTRGNPFKGFKVRSNDPRVQKAPRKPRIWSWEQMHAFCAAAAEPAPRDLLRVPPNQRAALKRRWEFADAWRAVYAEPMLRVLSDVGPRVGELWPLERRDVKLGERCDEQGCAFMGPHLHIRRTSWNGTVTDGTKTDHGEAQAGRTAPLAPALAAMLAGLPRRIDTPRVFPTPTGALFLDRNFYRDVWEPARKSTGLGICPHEMRHSYVSLMRAAGVDPADLAAWTGHSVLTATTRYTHSTGASTELGRRAVGS